MKDSGITHFRVHDLRHFCASLLLAQGVELKVVSEILGHAQISITADLYVHILPALKKDAAERMDAILAGVKYSMPRWLSLLLSNQSKTIKVILVMIFIVAFIGRIYSLVFKSL